MWQRIQTIFLLIAALAAIAFIFLPIAEKEQAVLLFVKYDIIATSVSVAIALLGFFTITQYKNRKLQMRFCFIIILLAIILFGASFNAANIYSDNIRYEFVAGVPLIIIISTILARRNINKDEALVKSMDRFR